MRPAYWIPAFSFMDLILLLVLPRAEIRTFERLDQNQLLQVIAVSPTPEPNPAQLEGIYDPKDGTVLGGEVVLTGTANSGWVLAFTFTDNPIPTWFPIAQSDKPTSNGVFAKWDTRNLTDGIYQIRLRVFEQDVIRDFFINIRVNNSNDNIAPTFSPTMTATPAPTLKVETITLTYLPVYTPTASIEVPSTTSLPISSTPTLIYTKVPDFTPYIAKLSLRNPVIIEQTDILAVLAKSFIIVFIGFGLTSLIFLLRKK